MLKTYVVIYDLVFNPIEFISYEGNKFQKCFSRTHNIFLQFAECKCYIKRENLKAINLFIFVFITRFTV